MLLDYFTFIDTPIGTMVAIANDKSLLALFFVDDDRQDEWTEQLSATAVKSINPVLELIIKELKGYFDGSLRVFTVSIDCVASTQFFADVLQSVQSISYGEIKTYGQIAKEIGKPGASRAVGAASKSNVLLLVIPCHRIIRGDGSLGGYSQGIDRKSWLLGHEQSFLVS
jgi:O-6-methylguanine DNA methyltransferase